MIILLLSRDLQHERVGRKLKDNREYRREFKDGVGQILLYCTTIGSVLWGIFYFLLSWKNKYPNSNLKKYHR